MTNEANDAQTGTLQPETQVQTEPQPSDEQIIQALIGTETKSPSVTEFMTKRMGASEFSRRREGS